MAFGKSKKETAAAPAAEQAYETGLHGTVAELRAFNAAAKTYVETKKAIFDAYDKKSNSGMSLMHSLSKYFQLSAAWEAAVDVPYQMHRELKKGAIEAFLDGHPENLQEMLAQPQEFLEDRYQNEKEFRNRLLIQLADKMPDAGVPLLALAKVGKEARQEILNDALYTLVNDYDDVEKETSALLAAGADASYSSSITLAAAIHKGKPAAVIDMLLENGASYQAALERMQAHSDYYGDKTQKIAYDEYRRETEARLEAQEKRIRELEETVAELTKKKDKASAPETGAAQKPAGPQPHAAVFVEKFRKF